MATTTDRIIFNIPSKLKKQAIKRAGKFDMTLTDVLREALENFVSGGVDNQPLSEAELASLKRSKEDIRMGRVISLEEVLKKYSVTICKVSY